MGHSNGYTKRDIMYVAQNVIKGKLHNGHTPL